MVVALDILVPEGVPIVPQGGGQWGERRERGAGRLEVSRHGGRRAGAGDRARGALRGGPGADVVEVYRIAGAGGETADGGAPFCQASPFTFHCAPAASAAAGVELHRQAARQLGYTCR